MGMSEITILIAKGVTQGQKLMIGVVLMVIVYWMLLGSPARREKKNRTDMLAAIKKSDRVMTVGGIVGSVVSVNESEVTLKVDESANVKITFLRSAIQRVLAEGEKPQELT